MHLPVRVEHEKSEVSAFAGQAHISGNGEMIKAAEQHDR